jgi:hypothetical protein
MKKCPTCEKTFDDDMRFCQVDGTPLVDDAPAVEEAPFDPYATIVGIPKPPASTQAAPPSDASEAPTAETPKQEILEPIVGNSVSSIPVSEPDEVLEVPGADPLKTMYVSDVEMKEVLGTAAGADTPSEEIKADEAEVEAAPQAAAPDFGDQTPPPSPFSTPPPADEAPVPAPPSFLETPPPSSEAETMVPPEVASSIQEPPPFEEAETMFQPQAAPFEPAAAPMQQQEWTPPPAPDAAWQNQQIGSNTPFQPPPAGAGGQNKTLAIISLVLGIVSLCCYVSPVTGIAALITGFLANKKANDDPNTYGGKGLALAGMICGGVFFLLGIIYWIYIIFVIGFAAMSGGFR